MVMKNPFVTNGYAGPEYFCDRVEETQHITEMLTNENNMALISPRRIGKTELIHHCFAQPVIQKDYYTFIIDIYSTNSVSDLVNMFGKAIIDELRPKGRSAWEKFLIALSSLRSEISFDINGAPVWGIGIGIVGDLLKLVDSNKAWFIGLVEISEYLIKRNFGIYYVADAFRTKFVNDGFAEHIDQVADGIG